MSSVLLDHSETTIHVPTTLGSVPKAMMARGLLLTGPAKVSSSAC